jgi:hypothetical protein
MLSPIKKILNPAQTYVNMYQNSPQISAHKQIVKPENIVEMPINYVRFHSEYYFLNSADSLKKPITGAILFDPQNPPRVPPNVLKQFIDKTQECHANEYIPQVKFVTEESGAFKRSVVNKLTAAGNDPEQVKQVREWMNDVLNNSLKNKITLEAAWTNMERFILDFANTLTINDVYTLNKALFLCQSSEASVGLILSITVSLYYSLPVGMKLVDYIVKEPKFCATSIQKIKYGIVARYPAFEVIHSDFRKHIVTSPKFWSMALTVISATIAASKIIYNREQVLEFTLKFIGDPNSPINQYYNNNIAPAIRDGGSTVGNLVGDTICSITAGVFRFENNEEAREFLKKSSKEVVTFLKGVLTQLNDVVPKKK